VDGDENLNVHLLEEGFFRASNLLPYLRAEDLLIPSEEMWAFRKKISAFEIAAAKAGKGRRQKERCSRWLRRPLYCFKLSPQNVRAGNDYFHSFFSAISVIIILRFD